MENHAAIKRAHFNMNWSFGQVSEWNNDSEKSIQCYICGHLSYICLCIAQKSKSTWKNM